MENVSRAIKLAFSMLMFVLGFSYSMYLINKLSTTASTLVSSIDTTSYYDSIEIQDGANSERTVGIDTVVSKIYRYYKESYAVKIIDTNGNVIQLFDTTVEGAITKAASTSDDEDKNTNQDIDGETSEKTLKNSIYNNKAEKAYMFQAAWTANTDEFAMTRINYFLNGTAGYINNSYVDYSKNGPCFSEDGGFLKNYNGSTFTEKFVEYAYSGETISTDDGIETITGSTKEKNKILILYIVNDSKKNEDENKE